MVPHTFNPSTQEAEAGGSLWVWGQPGLQELVLGQAPKLQGNPVLKTKNKFPNLTALSHSHMTIPTGAHSPEMGLSQTQRRLAFPLWIPIYSWLPWMAWSVSCRPGSPRTHRHPPASLPSARLIKGVRHHSLPDWLFLCTLKINS